MRSGAVARGWALLRADATRWIEPEQVAPLEAATVGRVVSLIVKQPSLRAMAWLRFGWTVRELGIRFVPMLVQQRLLTRFGLEISIGADVGGGLYIAHPVGCVLVAEQIGENVSVISQVTFGTRTDARWPTIGDRAFFGAGARVLGGIRIGDDVQVGANAVVIHDVSDGDTVVGIPARSVERRS